MKTLIAGLSAACLIAGSTAASAQTPLNVVQSALSQVFAVVASPDFAGTGNLAKRRAEIRRIATELFDFGEMARRALGRHWAVRSAEERNEFVRLFTEVLEQSFVTTVENYSGQRVLYHGEVIDGAYATVKSKIVTTRRAEIPIDYRLYQQPLGWAAFDIMIEGVSLVSNYRTQFDRIIRTSSFADLLKRMRQKDMFILAVRSGATKP
jgi:phospholipid transport system substrate-binding protein